MDVDAAGMRCPVMKKYLLYVLLFSGLLACTTSKRPIHREQINGLKTLMATGSFEFTADWAHPMVTQSLNAISNAGLLPAGSSIGAIQLNGTANFLKVKGDTVSANLAYYGERRFGGGYGAKAGIEFDGIPASYVQTYNEEKNRVDITFEISNQMEGYSAILQIFPNKTASITVTSNQRNTIRYTGTIAALENL